MRGKLIIIEGGEGCGKTSQAKALVEYLNSKGINSEYCREPGSVPEAEKIRSILLDKENNLHDLSEVYLFQAARAEFYDKIVLPKLNQGINLVSDRSGISTLAYQGYAGGQDLKLIKELNNHSTFGIESDLVIIIDVDTTKGLSKEQDPDRFAAKGKDYHKKVHEGYLAVAKEIGAFILNYEEGEFNEMQNEIRKQVDELFEK